MGKQANPHIPDDGLSDPVAEKCLAYAMECETNDIRRYGVWGGKTPREREYRKYGGGKLIGLAPLQR